jgi:uncharacterized protein GlcG (DUF336 family)
MPPRTGVPSEGGQVMKLSISFVRSVAPKLFAVFATTFLSCGGANAQGPGGARGSGNAPALVMQRNLSLAMAKTIAEASMAACQAKGFHTAVAVVDRAGQIMVILRDEEATAQHAEMARRKAYTARMFRRTTLDFQQRTNDPTYAGQRDLPDVLPLSGGVPIQVGSETIGGVGSAGSNLEQDDLCAKAGIAKVADLLK